jgi:hypothetical protein
MSQDFLDQSAFAKFVDTDYEIESLGDENLVLDLSEKPKAVTNVALVKSKINQELQSIATEVKSKDKFKPDFTELFKLIASLGPIQEIDTRFRDKVINDLKDFIAATVNINTISSVDIFYMAQAIAVLEGRVTVKDSIELFDSLRGYISNTLASTSFASPLDLDSSKGLAYKVYRRLHGGSHSFELPAFNKLVDFVGKVPREELMNRYTYFTTYKIAEVIKPGAGAGDLKCWHIGKQEEQVNVIVTEFLPLCIEAKDLYFKIQTDYKKSGKKPFTEEEFCQNLAAGLIKAQSVDINFGILDSDDTEDNIRYVDLTNLITPVHNKIVGQQYSENKKKNEAKPAVSTLTATPYLIYEKVSELITQERWRKEGAVTIGSKNGI